MHYIHSTYSPESIGFNQLVLVTLYINFLCLIQYIFRGSDKVKTPNANAKTFFETKTNAKVKYHTQFNLFNFSIPHSVAMTIAAISYWLFFVKPCLKLDN